MRPIEISGIAAWMDDADERETDSLTQFWRLVWDWLRHSRDGLPGLETNFTLTSIIQTPLDPEKRFQAVKYLLKAQFRPQSLSGWVRPGRFRGH